MEEEYTIEEKVYASRSKYVPVSMKLHKVGEPGYQRDAFPWHRIWSDRRIPKGKTVYIVTYIQHSGSDDGARLFFEEKDARKYIFALTRAISMNTGVQEVEVHYNNGLEDIFNVTQLPVNTYVNFRTPQDEYSITLGKTVYR